MLMENTVQIKNYRKKNMLTTFAQAADNVITVPVDQEIDTSSVETAANIFFWTTSILSILGIIHLVIFIIAIVHLVQNPTVQNRTLWIILSIFVPFGAWIYVLGPRRTFNKSGAAGSQNPFPQQNPGFTQPAANNTPYQAPTQQPLAQATPQQFNQPQPTATPVTPPTVEQPTFSASPTTQPEPAPFAAQQPAESTTFAPQQPELTTIAPEQPAAEAQPQTFSQDPIAQPPQDRQV